MCMFMGSRSNRTTESKGPTVYDGKGPAKKTDKRYRNGRAVLRAQQEALAEKEVGYGDFASDAVRL